jgi:aquaporin Z
MKVLTEFVGTLVFFFGISLAAVSGSPMAAMTIGSILMAMVYMGGHISGAHYNPAVSTAILIRGKMTSSEYVSYLVAQIVAALCAFGLGFWVTGKGVAIAPGEGVDVLKALFVEVIFTFALALVILNVATDKALAGNQFYGLAIGITIVGAVFAGGPISGGAFNPGVGIGATVINGLFNHGSFSNLWIYIVGPLVGGALAPVVYKATHPAEAEAA